eukprot:6000018-Alexandrium_andersonii.AAC.1
MPPSTKPPCMGSASCFMMEWEMVSWILASVVITRFATRRLELDTDHFSLSGLSDGAFISVS